MKGGERREGKGEKREWEEGRGRKKGVERRWWGMGVCFMNLRGIDAPDPPQGP